MAEKYFQDFNSYNSFQLLGTVVQEAKEGKTASGVPFIKFSIATYKSFKKPDGTYEKTPDFHNFQIFTPWLCKLIMNCPKGTKLLVLGELRSGKYTTKTGQTIYKYEPLVQRMVFCSNKYAEDRQERTEVAQNKETINEFGAMTEDLMETFGGDIL